MLAMRGEHLPQRSDGGDATGFEKDHSSRHAPDFGQIVRNVEHAHVQ